MVGASLGTDRLCAAVRHSKPESVRTGRQAAQAVREGFQLKFQATNDQANAFITANLANSKLACELRVQPCK